MRQVAGAIVGALLEALLVPGLHVGRNVFRAPGICPPLSETPPTKLLSAVVIPGTHLKKQ